MSKRLFIAFKYFPTNEILSFIKDIEKNFNDEKIKFVERNNIHLTLKFLGDTEEHQFAQLINNLKDISCNYHSFNINIIGADIFYRNSVPSVLYLKTEYNNKILRLIKDINISLNSIGFKSDKREIIPHITLARIKYLNRKKEFQNYIQNVHLHSQLLKIICFELVESVLSPHGPIYKTYEKFYFPE